MITVVGVAINKFKFKGKDFSHYFVLSVSFDYFTAVLKLDNEYQLSEI